MKIKQDFPIEEKKQNSVTATVPIVVKHDSLYFGDDSTIDSCNISFERTLRIPDDGKVYPLPPSFGSFPIKKVDDYLDRVPEDWKVTGGVFIPMHQREAMWMKFNGHRENPKALKIAVGKVNALSGKTWDQKLKTGENDYVVIPDQPWLDGINSGDGVIKQFVAMPLGEGYTVEEQVTGKAEFGGIQLCVYSAKVKVEKKKEVEGVRRYKKMIGGGFPAPNQPPMIPMQPQMSFFSVQSAPQFDMLECIKCEDEDEEFSTDRSGARELGLSSGGKMKQKIYQDQHGISFWNENEFGRIFVHIVNSAMYKNITGENAPETPIDAKTYKEYGYPWYDIYDEHKKDIKKSDILGNVKSVSEIDKDKYSWPQQDNSTVQIPSHNVITLKPKVKDSIRDGQW